VSARRVHFDIGKLIMAKADMFLRLEGKKSGWVKGESNVAGHVEEIELTDWSWGMTGSHALGGAGATARSALSEIRLGKGTDRSTTALMSIMRNNEEVKKAVITVRKAGANPPVDYLSVTVENGRISSHSIGNRSPNEPELVESLTLAFEKIEVKYAPQGTDGAKGAQSVFNAQVTNT
jgi:type VI secretion system secreted protein Hcp